MEYAIEKSKGIYSFHVIDCESLRFKHDDEDDDNGCGKERKKLVHDLENMVWLLQCHQCNRHCSFFAKPNNKQFLNRMRKNSRGKRQIQQSTIQK